MTELVLCECGCGVVFSKLDNRGRERKFLKGHWIKVRSNTEKMVNLIRPSLKGRIYKESANDRTCHYRSRHSISASKCELIDIGHCKGPIQVAHINGDFTDNDTSNLISLCASHHRLMDLGRIDLKKPVMPEFYTDSGGKRRYKSPYWNKDKKVCEFAEVDKKD